MRTCVIQEETSLSRLTLKVKLRSVSELILQILGGAWVVHNRNRRQITADIPNIINRGNILNFKTLYMAIKSLRRTVDIRCLLVGKQLPLETAVEYVVDVRVPA